MSPHYLFHKKRILILLALSLLLHFIFLAIGNSVSLHLSTQSNPTIINAEIKTIAPPAIAPPVKKINKSTQVARKTPSPPAEPIVDTTPTQTTEPTTLATTSDTSNIPDTSTPTSAPPANNTDDPHPAHQGSPPPAVEISYNVAATRGGQLINGSGTIRWATDNHTYTIHGDASVVFLTLLEFNSEGTINQSGLVPVLYSEKPFRKSMTNTHFQANKGIISFSASTLTYPYQGGEQDRASIPWQLASIGRANPSLFIPGATLSIFVAEVRDAQVWDMHIIDDETVQTDAGTFKAWHLVRSPRPGTFDKKIEIWLAHEKNWYPIKLRHTENNGNILDMVAKNIRPIN